jgi:hypothetical protein
MAKRKARSQNCQFDSWPLNVDNRPDFLLCKWCATYHWKALKEGYKFSLNLTSIRYLHTKLWDSKIVKVPILGITKLPLGSPRTKWHFGASPVAKHKKYYKREGGGFPQVQAVVSFVNLCLFVVRSCIKNAPTMH